eukprot:TRINITY_DN51788_c0_g1_i1.p1 TRINITY_DN51788_c0_g1~~TRINITY_DN51788_c0_g1_i1.p1  ORF type:complete len:776 (+),score=106.30 TRINITY_DN51788_c0_g1_i1:292-2328(+)
MHDGDTLNQMVCLSQAKDAHHMALNLETVGSPSSPHKIAIAVKKKILVFAYTNADEYNYSQDLVLSSNVVTLGYYGVKLCCGYAKEYSLLNASNGETVDLMKLDTSSTSTNTTSSSNEGGPNGAQSTTQPSQQPLVFQMNNQALVRCGPIAAIVDEQPTTGDATTDNKEIKYIHFSAEPQAFGRKHPYIFGLLNDKVEAYSLYEESLVDEITLLKGCFLCTNAGSKNDKLVVANRSQLFSIQVPTVKQQIEHMVTKLQISEAFDFLEKYPAKNQQLQDERTLKLHATAGVVYLKHHKFAEAFSHLTSSGTDARNLLWLHFGYCCCKNRPSSKSKQPETSEDSEFEPDLNNDLLLPDSEITALQEGGGCFSSLRLVIGGNNNSRMSLQPTTNVDSSSSSSRPAEAPDGSSLIAAAHSMHHTLVAYLQHRRKVSKVDQELRAIDYALVVLCCLEGLVDKLYDLLTSPTNHCCPDDCVPLLKRAQHFRLIGLLLSHKKHEDDANSALRKNISTMYTQMRSQCQKPKKYPTEWAGLDDATLDPAKELSKLFVGLEIAKPDYISSTLKNVTAITDKTDSVGNTVLHYAVLASAHTDELLPVVCRLVDNGFDIHQQNGFGFSSLDIAMPKVAGTMRAVADVHALITRSAAPPTPNLSTNLPTIPTPPTPATPSSVRQSMQSGFA